MQFAENGRRIFIYNSNLSHRDKLIYVYNDDEFCKGVEILIFAEIHVDKFITT